MEDSLIDFEDSKEDINTDSNRGVCLFSCSGVLTEFSPGPRDGVLLVI